MIKKLLSLFILVSLLMTGCIASQEDVFSRNIGLLQEANPYLRKQAVAALGALLEERVILPITEMLSDADLGVVSQAEVELSKLREKGLSVDERILQEIGKRTFDDRMSMVKYLIKMDLMGTDWQEQLWVTLCEVNAIANYRELVVFLYTKEGSTLKRELMEMLEGENHKLASDVLLLLDGAGYRPSVVFINDLIAQGALLNDVSGTLLARYASRESFIIGNNPHDQLLIQVEDGEILISDHSDASQERCQKGDELWQTTSAKLHWAMRLALLNSLDLYPTIQDVYEKLWTGDEDFFYTLFQRELSEFQSEPTIVEEIVQFMANEETIRQKLRTEINPSAAIDGWLDENETRTEEQNSKKVLVIDQNKALIDAYHWRLPQEYRVVSTADTRYLLVVSVEDRVMILTDMMFKERLLDVSITEDSDFTKLLEDVIAAITIE